MISVRFIIPLPSVLRKWRVFTRWCDDRGITALDATIPQVADFLNYLYDRQGLRPTTIDGYRVAIAGALKHRRGVSISKDPALLDLSTWMHRDRPRSSSTAPPWDLSLVLASLQEPPFEPIQDPDKVSLRHLTWKTAFLLLLASGARRGEIHAIEYASLQHDPKWKFVVLKPHLDFISKTQLRSQGATKLDSITIKGFMEFVGPDLDKDRKLCPVRCLKAYLARTQGMRQGKKLLLISHLPEFKQDIHKNTVSGWIRKLIKYVYDNASENALTLSNTSTHAVRGMAASLAFRGGIDLETVLASCSWKNDSTFTAFYLKDISVVQQNLYKLGPLVVAQSVINT